MILAVLFAVIAIVLLCSLLITLTIYALPFYVGLTVGIWMHSNGTGAIGTSAAAIIAGIATLVIVHILIATVHSPVLRAGLGLIFAAPAAFAAYHARCMASRLPRCLQALGRLRSRSSAQRLLVL